MLIKSRPFLADNRWLFQVDKSANEVFHCYRRLPSALISSHPIRSDTIRFHANPKTQLQSVPDCFPFTFRIQLTAAECRRQSTKFVKQMVERGSCDFPFLLPQPSSLLISSANFWDSDITRATHKDCMGVARKDRYFKMK